jgi:hypothetical protein
MNFFTKVPRESVEHLDDLEMMRALQLELINIYVYRRPLDNGRPMTPRHLNKIAFQITQIEIWIKENSTRILKAEFAVKPIKLFDRERDNHKEYEHLKRKQHGASSNT